MLFRSTVRSSVAVDVDQRDGAPGHRHAHVRLRAAAGLARGGAVRGRQGAGQLELDAPLGLRRDGQLRGARLFFFSSRRRHTR